MLQGLYAASSGMEAQQNQFNAISNDLANINTPGYQSTEVGFEDLLYSNGGVSTGTHAATGSGAGSAIIGRSQLQGALQNTGRPLDVAIEGEGYLQVRRPDGSIGLTRNGALQLDSSGHIVNAQGDELVPPISVPKGTSEDQIAIAGNGDVTVGKRAVGRISVVSVPAPDKLLPQGDSLFAVTAGSGATRPAAGTKLQSGALEASNVDIAQAMGDMINAERSYQMSSQAVQYQDQMLEIANQLRHS
jgi:flagellar basal-body rod protein FlgG